MGEKFVEYVKPRPDWEGPTALLFPRQPIRKNGTADESHFWLYSMLAAVFYWPLKLLGADVGLSFNCLHVVLLYVAVVLVHRRLGPAAACSLLILVVGSPVLWYANKAHTELFTVVLGSLGTAYLAGRRARPFGPMLRPGGHAEPGLRTGRCWRWPWGLSVDGVIGCEGFAPRHSPSLPLSRKGRGGHRQACSPTGNCWPWLRPCWPCIPFTTGFARAASPMLIGPELLLGSYFLPLRHMASFWIDPDVGLLATWPLGLPLLIAGAS